MSEQRLKELMSALIAELQDNDGVDPDTLELARKLDVDIEELTDPDVESDSASMLDDAIALEARFAASHPVAEKTIRELINSLSKIGI